MERLSDDFMIRLKELDPSDMPKALKKVDTVLSRSIRAGDMLVALNVNDVALIIAGAALWLGKGSKRK